MNGLQAVMSPPPRTGKTQPCLSGGENSVGWPRAAVWMRTGITCRISITGMPSISSGMPGSHERRFGSGSLMANRATTNQNWLPYRHEDAPGWVLKRKKPITAADAEGDRGHLEFARFQRQHKISIRAMSVVPAASCPCRRRRFTPLITPPQNKGDTVAGTSRAAGDDGMSVITMPPAMAMPPHRLASQRRWGV